MHFGQAFKARLLQWMPIFVLICGIGFACGQSFAAESDVSVEPLRAKYLELSAQLRNNPFQRALYLDSSQSSTDLKGEIYVVVDYPFAIVNGALMGMSRSLRDYWQPARVSRRRSPAGPMALNFCVCNRTVPMAILLFPRVGADILKISVGGCTSANAAAQI